MSKRTDSKKNRKAGSHTRQAYQGIRQMLFHSEIVPGQKIGYRDLAERLGMSQTPVIQALKWLEFQGLVRHEANRGYYTEPVSNREVEEIYALRELIECDLLGATVERLDAAAMDRLQSAAIDHEKAASEVYLLDRLVKDMDFHLCLASLAGQQLARQTLENLFDRLYLKYGGRILFSSSMEKAAQDHRHLMNCLAEKDLAGSRQVLAEHIRRVRRHVLEGLSRQQRSRDATRW